MCGFSEGKAAKVLWCLLAQRGRTNRSCREPLGGALKKPQKTLKKLEAYSEGRAGV